MPTSRPRPANLLRWSQAARETARLLEQQSQLLARRDELMSRVHSHFRDFTRLARSFADDVAESAPVQELRSRDGSPISPGSPRSK